MRLYARRLMHYRPPDKLCELIDRKIPACANIEYLSLPHFLAFSGKKVRLHDIANMREVARLGAIAPNCQGLPFLPLPQKFPDCERVCAVRIEPWAIHIEIAQTDGFKFINLAPNTGVQLSDIFLQAIG